MKLHPILIPVALLLGGCVSDDASRRPEYEYKGVLGFEDIAPIADREADSTAGHSSVWTVEELAFRAGSRCADIREGAFEVASKQLKKSESLAWKDPELRFGRDFEEDGNDTDSLSARLYIPNPFVDRYLRRQAEASIAARKAKACTDAFAVYSEVKLLCNEVLLLEKRIKLMERKRQLRADLVEMEQRRFDSGLSSTPYEVLRANNRMRNSERKVAEMVDRERRLKSKIAILAELPQLDFTIEEIQVNPPKELDDLDALCEIAFSRRPDLAEAIHELEEAEARVGEAKAANLPWFRFVEGSYSVTPGEWDPDTGLTDADEHEYGVKVSLTIPIFDWCGNRVSVAKSVRDRASDRLDSLYSAIRREIETAVFEYRTMQALCENSADDAYVSDMYRKIDAVDMAGGKKDDEKSHAELELIDLEISILDRLTAAREAYLQLESVVGGPL